MKKHLTQLRDLTTIGKIFVVIGLLGVAQCSKPSDEARSGNGSKPDSPSSSHTGQPRPKEKSLFQFSDREIQRLHQTDKTLQKNALELVNKYGFRALEEISASHSGDDLNEMMNVAINRLAEDHTKVELIEFLSGLPPGRNKQGWIWSAIERGQGDYGEAFFSAVDDLDYSEERMTAIHAYTNFANIEEADNFDAAFDFLSRQRGIENGFLESMKKRTVREYAASLYKLGPASAAGNVSNFPEEFRSDAVRRLAEVFWWDKGAGEAIKFALELKDFEGLSEEVFSRTFKEIGSSDPQKFNLWIDQVPKEYRGTSVENFVSGWLEQNSIAASRWIVSQPREIQELAAPQVINFLEHKGAHTDEIEPWKDLAGNP